MCGRFGDLLLLRPVQAQGGEVLGGFPRRGDAAAHGLADVREPHERAAEKQAGFAGHPDLAVRFGGDNAAVIQGGINQAGHLDVGLIRHLARGHDHQVVVLHKELVGVGVDVADGQGAVRLARHPLHPAADEVHAVLAHGLVPVLLEAFAEGAHVHVENGGVDVVPAFFLGQDGFLEGEHAADGGTVVPALAPVAGPHALDPGDVLDRLAVGRPPDDAALEGAGAAQHALEGQGGHHVGGDGVGLGVLVIPGVVELHPGGQDDGVDLFRLGLVLGVQVDGPGGAHLDAFAAAGAGVFVDEQHLGGVVGHRLVDGLARGQPLVELIRDLHRADVHAVAHLAADGRVDEAGLFQQVDLVVARIALYRGDLRKGQDLDIFVEQAFPHAILRGVLPAHHGEHPAHAAMIRRELVVQLGQDAAHLGGIVGQNDLVARLRQLNGRLDPGNAGTSHQDRAHRLLFSHHSSYLAWPVTSNSSSDLKPARGCSSVRDRPA